MVAESTKKRPFLSPVAKTVLGIAIIVVAGVLALFFAPPEGESNNTTGDTPPGTSALVITNQLEQININRGLDYKDVHIKFTQAILASKFSDDHKRNGTYTVRIITQANNINQQPAGVDYVALSRLMLPDGTAIPTKLISVKADQLPGNPQTGFLDFPVSSHVQLSELKLQFGETVIPFKS